MNFEAFRTQYLDLISNLFSEQDNARGLLEDITFPRNHIPAFESPQSFWRQVGAEVERGATPGGLEALLQAAANRYPHNGTLQAFRTRSPESRGAQSTPARGITIMVENFNGVQHELYDRVRALAARFGCNRTSLDLATESVVSIWLDGVTSDQALQVMQQLRNQLAEFPDVRVTTAREGYRDYFYQRISIEGPDQRRFQLSNVPASTPIGDVTQTLERQYVEQHQAWPVDGTGTPRRAVADVLAPDGRAERVTADRTLHEAGIVDGGTIQISPESNAGVNAILREQALVRTRNQIAEFANGNPGWTVDANARRAPTEYLIAFETQGFAPPENGQRDPIPIDRHQVLISLPDRFPIEAPKVFWQTPIFHPNIDPKTSGVCLGELQDKYKPGLDFNKLCQLLVDIAGMKNYNHRPGECLNIAAADWITSPQGQEAVRAMGGAEIAGLSSDGARTPERPPRAMKLRSLY